MAKKSAARSDGTPSFEEALTQLEEVVGKLEAGELSLEDSLSTFEQGVGLVRLCTDRLKAAQLRVQQLQEGRNGPEEQPLELEEER